MGWISCKDQMPEFRERVLAVTKRNGIKVLARYPGTQGIWHPHPSDWVGESVSSVIQRIALDQVTHWMPLPPFPDDAKKGWLE